MDESSVNVKKTMWHARALTLGQYGGQTHKYRLDMDVQHKCRVTMVDGCWWCNELERVATLPNEAWKRLMRLSSRHAHLNVMSNHFF